MIVIGVDPGPTTGMCRMDTGSNYPWSVRQMPAVEVVEVLRLWSWDPVPHVLAVERYHVSTRSARNAHPRAQAIAMRVQYDCEQWARENGIHVSLRYPADVKNWATDARLIAAGLLSITKGLPHARDAARHALYEAVRAGYMSDPLSGKEMR